MRAKNNLPWIAAGVTVAAFLAALGWGFTFGTNSYTTLPYKWLPGSLPMRIQADNITTLSDGTTRATAIQTAMQDSQRGWNQYLGNVQFAPSIRSAASGTDGNGVNEIFFASSPYGKDWDDNTLALTTGWTSGERSNNERLEADIIFNSTKTWDSYRGASRATSSSGPYDIQRVALHELGHVLGLDHPDEAGQSVSAIMNSRSNNLDSLTSDDITGAQSLYGPGPYGAVPPNDNFANATAISFSGSSTTLTGFNTNATKEVGEPNHAGNIGGRSVWWKWTAPASTMVTLDTKGSYFDTTLAVYTGSAVSMLTLVAANDDIQDGVRQNSSLTFNATADTTYYIAVDGFNGVAQGYMSGADSAGITLNLAMAVANGTAPQIATQPSSLTVTAGTSVSFSVSATGTAPLNYQWNFNGTAVSGATSATYSLNNVQSANAGTYTVTVSNSVGSVTSSGATLTVNPVSTPPSSGSGGGGGGGGGAPSEWFLLTLGVAGLARLLRRTKPVGSPT